MEILIFALLFLILFSLVLVFFSFLIRFRQIRYNSRIKYTVLEMQVPRESEIGPIAAEHIFATFHGISGSFSFWQKLKGISGPSISFEIASIGNQIKFYVAFPSKLRNLVEGQIYAQYPDVEIRETKDYSLNLSPEYKASSMELKLISGNFLPVKRYSQFVTGSDQLFDPLAGITSSLVKFPEISDQAWISVVITPLPDKWRKIFGKCMQIVNAGFLSKWNSLRDFYISLFTTRSFVLRLFLFPLFVLFKFQTPRKIEEKSGEIREVVSSKHENETPLSASVDKVSRMLFDVSIRAVYASKKYNSENARLKLQEIAASFKQFNQPHLNGFEIGSIEEGENVLSAYRKRLLKNSFVLNNEELASIYHLPSIAVKTPKIFWISCKKLEPPQDLPLYANEDDVTILGETDFRGDHKVFGIRPIDRNRHLYMIGKTGMGKSTVLENMIYSDIMSGKGVGVIDPHGDLADKVLSFIPPKRLNDVILVEPFDKENAVAFNMLENIDKAYNSIVCSGIVGIFKKIYADSWGPRLEHILRNTILALLEYPGTTMLGIIRMLQDNDFRRKVVKKVTDPVVRGFWVNEFDKMQDRIRVEAISPILNKVGQFLSSNTIRNIVGQPKSSINLRFAMDKGKIVIINLSKGKMGEDNSALLGSMFITKFQLDAMSRADIPEKERKNFYLYVDEFQNFATDSFATILSEARKYKLNLTMANQYIAQMPDEVRDAVFGNVGSLFSFQVGFDDAETISKQFGEEVLPADLVSLSKYTAYMRLLVDNMPSKTFSLRTLPPPNIDIPDGYLNKVRRVANERYSNKISVVEDKIRRWSESGEEKEDSPKSSDRKFKK
jgi:hypothetical protein